MESHALGQSCGYIKGIIKPLWEKPEKRMPQQAESVGVVSPVNKHTAPDHDGEYREINPMRPSHYKRMFLFYNLHLGLPAGLNLLISGEIKRFQLQVRIKHAGGFIVCFWVQIDSA